MKVLLNSIIFIFAYLVGSIPSGAMIARFFGVKDITKHGSGNIGATNVARVLGKKYFFVVLFFDSIKAFIFLIALQYYGCSEISLVIAAGFLLLGNGFSIFLGGKGGKGIATGLGIILALVPNVLPGLCCVWLLVLSITQVVGIASIVTLFALPLLYGYIYFFKVPLFMLVNGMSIWGLYRHTDNLKHYFKSK